ncbi:hypothetical protein GCM10009602_56500 [Nocardiopsis tropica]
MKIFYDSLIEGIKSRKEKASLFIEERKEVYDRFLKFHREQAERSVRLYEIALIARVRKDVTKKAYERVSESSLPGLVMALDEIRRLARTSEMVRVAERMVALHGDMAAANRVVMFWESNTYGLPYFLVCCLREDQEREFIHAYRNELGIGPPKGARPNYPIVGREISVAESEKILRLHLKNTGTDSHFTVPESSLYINDDDKKILKKLHAEGVISGDLNDLDA